MNLTSRLNFSTNFQDCPGVNSVLSNDNGKLANATGLANFGLEAMGAVETDFSCAGMCGNSYLYTFSDVTRGPPE